VNERMISKLISQEYAGTPQFNAISNYAALDLHNIKRVKYRKNNVLKHTPRFFLRDWKHNERKVAEEYCWAITGFGAVRLLPIGFQCV
jgi:hypothetical protein